MTTERIKPGAGSYLIVILLLFEAILELVVMPFRLGAFLLRKTKVSNEISRLLRDRQDDAQGR
jgi:hypothetical protein